MKKKKKEKGIAELVKMERIIENQEEIKEIHS